MHVCVVYILTDTHSRIFKPFLSLILLKFVYTSVVPDFGVCRFYSIGFCMHFTLVIGFDWMIWLGTINSNAWSWMLPVLRANKAVISSILSLSPAVVYFCPGDNSVASHPSNSDWPYNSPHVACDRHKLISDFPGEFQRAGEKVHAGEGHWKTKHQQGAQQ